MGWIWYTLVFSGTFGRFTLVLLIARCGSPACVGSEEWRHTRLSCGHRTCTGEGGNKCARGRTQPANRCIMDKQQNDQFKNRMGVFKNKGKDQDVSWMITTRNSYSYQVCRGHYLQFHIITVVSMWFVEPNSKCPESMRVDIAAFCVEKEVFPSCHEASAYQVKPYRQYIKLNFLLYMTDQFSQLS